MSSISYSISDQIDNSNIRKHRRNVAIPFVGQEIKLFPHLNLMYSEGSPIVFDRQVCIGWQLKATCVLCKISVNENKSITHMVKTVKVMGCIQYIPKETDTMCTAAIANLPGKLAWPSPIPSIAS